MANADDADGKELVKMIVKLYVTIQGFSFASSFSRKQIKKHYRKVKGYEKNYIRQQLINDLS